VQIQIVPNPLNFRDALVERERFVECSNGLLNIQEPRDQLEVLSCVVLKRRCL